jgi:hypothetical protein
MRHVMMPMLPVDMLVEAMRGVVVIVSVTMTGCMGVMMVPVQRRSKR